MNIVKWWVTVASALALLPGTAASAVRQTAPACSSTNLPAWSPDGKQIAFVGRRLGHGPLSVRAICVATADGTNTAPLQHTTCTRRCRLDLIDSPTQLFWVQPNLLLYGDDFRIFTIPVGGQPQLLGREPGIVRAVLRRLGGRPRRRRAHPLSPTPMRRAGDRPQRPVRRTRRADRWSEARQCHSEPLAGREAGRLRPLPPG